MEMKKKNEKKKWKKGGMLCPVHKYLWICLHNASHLTQQSWRIL